MAGKPIRLGKAAGELNVGVSTLVEFLDSKGVKIDANPNTKLEEEHFDLLRKEFAADLDLKEQSKFTTVKRERRETVSIRDKGEETAPAEAADDDEDSEPINVEEIKRNIFEPPVEKVAPVVVEAPEPTPEPIPEPVPEPAPKNPGEVHVSVVGKIDLDKLNTKTRPDKKKDNEPKVEAAPVEKVEEKPVVVEPVVEEKPQEDLPKEIETIRAERTVLTGPKVMGRIELPVEKPKTPGVRPGSHAQSEADRKKRKRIKKIDTTKTPDNNSGQAGGAGTARPPRPGGAPGQRWWWFQKRRRCQI
jgi:translation initiation factor IF-2